MHESIVKTVLIATGFVPDNAPWACDVAGGLANQSTVHAEDGLDLEAAIGEIARELDKAVYSAQGGPLSDLHAWIEDWAKDKEKAYPDLPSPHVLFAEQMRRSFGLTLRTKIDESLMMSFRRPISTWAGKYPKGAAEMERLACACLKKYMPASCSRQPDAPAFSDVEAECVGEPRLSVPVSAIAPPSLPPTIPITSKQSAFVTADTDSIAQAEPAEDEAPLVEKPPSDPPVTSQSTHAPTIAPVPQEAKPPKNESGIARPIAAWKYLPLPDEPDSHDEYDVRTGQCSDGRMILGARVRGKKHKHEGTQCDDWFEFANVGAWTVFAVADGGGNYKFSRVGARAACTGAVRYLTQALIDCSIRPRETLTVDIEKEPEYVYAKNALQDGMKAAWASVMSAYEDRADSWKRIKILPTIRDLSLKDLYSTLLVAIRTSVKTANGTRSLILGWAAGDGMVAAITRDGDCKLLMKPDSGEFSAEVEFFTQKSLQPDSLDARTYPLISGTRALMLMTDGVADDYFPHDRRMGELYADLVLNGIIPLPEMSDEQVAADMKATKLQSMEAVASIDLLVESERLLETPERAILASAKKLAKALGIEPHMLAKRPGLLAAALAGPARPMPGIGRAEDRLLVWLDAYHVRGSFDDRTLIVMSGGDGR